MDIHIRPLEDSALKPLFTDPDELGFGRVFTDRMFTMEWEEGKGWHNATISKYENLSLDPATLVFHYGQEIFEGLKAFATPDGDILFFRPQENVKRFNLSANRLCMPELNEEEMMQAIIELVKVESRWIPRKKGSALYIRPTMISTEVGLGVRPSNKYLFFVILSPVGPYFREGFKPVSLLVTDEYVRAAHGGVGEAKTGVNYAASLYAQHQAKDRGFKEVLWLDSSEHRYIQEVGAMNMFFVIDGVVTTPALDGAILHGVTRKSVLALAESLGYKTAERKVDIHEVVEAISAGKLTEAFGSGTAASISPVGSLNYRGKDYVIGDRQVGPVAQALYSELQAIQYGEKPDTFGWTVRVPMPKTCGCSCGCK